MKTISKALIILVGVLLANQSLANGVLIFDASAPSCARLVSSQVSVSISDQVAITQSAQIFLNPTGVPQPIKYAFPLPDGASATKLRWFVGGMWHTALVTEVKQDTSLPGGTPAPDLKTYLGPTPLYFGLAEQLAADSSITFELTYVQLLSYKNGIVTYSAPDDYSLISTLALETQRFNVDIASQRTIESVVMNSHPSAVVNTNGTTASVTLTLDGSAATANYVMTYQLNTTQFGLYGITTKLPDSLGYFVVIVEPDPNTTAIIRKNFVIIVDRSGSMSGIKMTQAVAAGQYIVNNLNEGDSFNVIDFDDIISSFRGSLVPFTSASRDSALLYIGSLYARGLTDISGAFSAAIPQFAPVPDSTANIVLFLTDGIPTAGQTFPDSIIAIVSRLVQQTNRTINVYTFGIGSDVNKQLLTLLASQNYGFADFLGNDEVQIRVTEFYNTVRNPLIITPIVQFAPDSVYEVYPDPLPNLYKGQQMIITGRYLSSGPVTVTFAGTAFGKPVSYQYVMTLADTAVPNNEFLTKVWAKLKIEHLLVEYYAAAEGSYEATQIKNLIIQISVKYGVQSPFTSFIGPSSIEERATQSAGSHPVAYALLGNYPNPFNPGTNIRFRILADPSHLIVVKIFTIQGQLIRTLLLRTNGPDEYQVYWDGANEAGTMMASGTYIYTIDFGTTLLAGKMILLR